MTLKNFYFTMQMFAPIPDWIKDYDGKGEIKCDRCKFATNSQSSYDQHANAYHQNTPFILYYECDGSIEGREKLAKQLRGKFQWMDMTGGQAAWDDGDIKAFGEALVKASRLKGVKLFGVYRMYDPGLGLDFPEWWLAFGVKLGVFQSYDLPQDVRASNH